MVVEGDWLKDLPNRWRVFRLSEGLLTDIQPGFACGKTNTDGIGIPQLRPMNVNSKGNILFEVLKFVPKEEIHSNTRLVRSGDIIFNNTNSPELVGKTALYEGSDEIAFSNHMTRLRVNPDLLYPKFLSLLLHFLWQTGYYKNICNNHVSQSSISKQVLLSIPIPLPPLEEQHRIITDIENLLGRVEATKERLNRVPTIMQQFRQSVLAAACSGILTEDWRERNQCEEIFQCPESDFDSFPCEFPSTWKIAKLRDLAAKEKYSITDGPFGSNLKTEHYSESGPRVIRLQNIGNGKFINIFAHISQSHFETLKKHQIFPNDLVVALLGEPIPRCCIIPDNIGPAIVKADCVRFKPNSDLAISKFLMYAINEPKIRDLIKELIHGVARPRLNLTQIKSLQLPLPPLEEQQEICRRVDNLFAHADNIEAQVAVARERVETITQSILHQAFTGKLIPLKKISVEVDS